MAEWAFQIARNVSGDREPDELTLDRLLAADPDAWEQSLVVSVVPRVPTEGGRMPKGIATNTEDRELLDAAVKVAGSINALARMVDDDRTPTAVGQQIRQMLKGRRALEPGRSRILQTARGVARGAEAREVAPEVIDVEGEPYVKAEPGSVHPALDEHVYVPADKENGPHADDVPRPTAQVQPGEPIVRPECEKDRELFVDLVDALRAVLLTEADDGSLDRELAELKAAKLLLRLES